MNKIDINKEFINIQAYKHDGTLYRQWNGARIVGSSKDYVLVLLNKTKVQESKNQKWVITEPIIWFFSTNKFFNVTLTIKEDGCYYYANLSSPFFFEDNTIKYIDYDYDIKKYPRKKFSIVDHNDFINNKDWYDEDTKNVIYQNLVELAEMSIKKESIFNETTIKEVVKKLISIRIIDKKHFVFLFNSQNR
jgi:protein associated with RNAse G/E